jgi:hypothetical protein
VAKVVRRVKRKVDTGRRIRTFRVGAGLPSVEKIRFEMKQMRDVLLGRVEAPVVGLMAMQEVADAFFGRACEIEQLILEAEAEGFIDKKGEYHSLRTQEIRSFKEMAKSSAELGSRRLTYEKLLFDQETTGRESAG